MSTQILSERNHTTFSKHQKNVIKEKLQSTQKEVQQARRRLDETLRRINNEETQKKYQRILAELREILTEPPAVYNALIRAVQAHDANYPLTRNENTAQPVELREILTEPPAVYNALIRAVQASDFENTAQRDAKTNTKQLSTEQTPQEHDLDDNRIREYIIAVIATERKMYETQKVYTSYKKEELQEYTRQLSARIDFDAIISEYMTGEKNISFATLLDTIRQTLLIRAIEYRLTQGEPLNYNQLAHYEEVLKINAKRLEAHGFLRKPNDPENTTYVPNCEGEAIKAKRKETIQTGKKIVDELEANRRIIQIYKHKQYRDKKVEDILYSLEMQNIYTEQETTREILEVIDYDPRYIQAVKRFFLQKRDKLKKEGRLHMTSREKKQFRRKARNTNTDEIGAKITITDTHQKKEDAEDADAIEIVTPQNIQNILTQLPPALLKGITEIKITQEQKGKKIGALMKKYNPREDDTISRIEIYIPRFAPKSARDKEKMAQKSKLLLTLIHECAHQMHTKLPLDELEEWEEVIQKEKINITWYVKQTREENLPQTNCEDFAESVKIYMTKPAVLLTCAPKRFRYIDNLMKTYMPPEQWQNHKMIIKKKIRSQTMKWKKSGYKAKDIKAIYLA